MLIKGIIDEDFVNYKIASMNISTSTCSFKCDYEAGCQCCQNSELALQPTIDVPTCSIIERYLSNPITHAIVFAGLEPLDQFAEVLFFIHMLREHYHCNDTVVIYSGYYESEVASKIAELKSYPNIIVKYGRFIPNSQTRYDTELGIVLASNNQYAERIS